MTLHLPLRLVNDVITYEFIELYWMVYDFMRH